MAATGLKPRKPQERAETRPAGAANDWDAARKPALRFFTCGSVDDGKSTLIGRLLYEAGAVFDDQLDALEADSRRFGTQGAALDFALLVDGLSAEREQGITIDVAYRYFATARRSFIVADTPGHEQYTRNMATGASTAELAIILVDARLGLLHQTRRHSSIVALAGVRSVVLAVNKMDLVGYDEAVFRRIEADYAEVAARLGFAQLTAIPLSARDGDNVAIRSAAMPWYRGPALLPFLEGVEAPAPTREGSAVLPVQWVNRRDASFRGYAGTIARGAIAVGDELAVLPSGRTSTVSRIVTPAGEAVRASAGQPVTIALADAIDVSRGDWLVAADRRPVLRDRLRARLLWTGETPLSPTGSYMLKIATTTVGAAVGELHHAIDVHSLSPARSDGLAMNDIGLVTLLLDRPVVALTFAQSVELGGFILIDRTTQETVALGFVGEGEAVAQPSEESLRASGEPQTRRVGTAVMRWFGPRGSLGRSQRYGQIAAHVFASVGLVLLLQLGGAEPLTACGVGLADFVLRPVLILGAKLVAGSAWRRQRARAATAAENAAGGGI